ncbi:MAG: hypothetical protein ACKO81_13905, partial [Planctomycetota bacterium]
GFGFVWNHPVILGALSLDMFAVLLGGAVTLLPIFSEEILRVGPKVVQLNRELAETSATLEQLYEHWMEALELNG